MGTERKEISTPIIADQTDKNSYLDGGEGGDDGRAAESVRDKRKVRQMALDIWLQDDLRSSVAQWRPVLVEQVHQLFGDLPIIYQEKGKSHLATI